MTVLSVLVGQIFHAVPTGLTRGLPIDDIIAVISFSYFGIKSLLDASALEDGDNSGMEEEAEEAEKELDSVGKAGKWALIGEAFALTFAAELGDRSQLTTIALSAAQNPFAVCIGAIIAHCIATGGAVLGGSFISKYLSEKVIGCAAEAPAAQSRADNNRAAPAHARYLRGARERATPGSLPCVSLRAPPLLGCNAATSAAASSSSSRRPRWLDSCHSWWPLRLEAYREKTPSSRSRRRRGFLFYV